MADLLILAHGGSWDMRFQISSLAARPQRRVSGWTSLW
jgi:hypothetical protein